jgi:hypothetical protein
LYCNFTTRRDESFADNLVVRPGRVHHLVKKGADFHPHALREFKLSIAQDLGIDQVYYNWPCDIRSRKDDFFPGTSVLLPARAYFDYLADKKNAAITEME